MRWPASKRCETNSSVCSMSSWDFWTDHTILPRPHTPPPVTRRLILSSWAFRRPCVGGQPSGLTPPGLPCSLEFVGRTPHESLLDAARFLPSVDVAEQRRLRLSSGRESGCGLVDQLDLEGRRFVDHACPTKYACIAVANSSAESPARFTGQLCHNLDSLPQLSQTPATCSTGRPQGPKCLSKLSGHFRGAPLLRYDEIGGIAW